MFRGGCQRGNRRLPEGGAYSKPPPLPWFSEPPWLSEPVLSPVWVPSPDWVPSPSPSEGVSALSAPEAVQADALPFSTGENVSGLHGNEPTAAVQGH